MRTPLKLAALTLALTALLASCTPPSTPNPGPGPVTPGPVEPGPVDPGPVDPGPVDPGPVNPGPKTLGGVIDLNPDTEGSAYQHADSEAAGKTLYLFVGGSITDPTKAVAQTVVGSDLSYRLTLPAAVDASAMQTFTPPTETRTGCTVDERFVSNEGLKAASAAMALQLHDPATAEDGVGLDLMMPDEYLFEETAEGAIAKWTHHMLMFASEAGTIRYQETCRLNESTVEAEHTDVTVEPGWNLVEMTYARQVSSTSGPEQYSYLRTSRVVPLTAQTSLTLHGVH